MAKKYTVLTVLALIPLLAACGGSEAKKVGDATCQNYADALDNYDSDSSQELRNNLSEDAGIDADNATLADSLTYQLMDYCGIDVATFLQGSEIQLEDGEKKLADFTFVVPSPESTH